MSDEQEWRRHKRQNLILDPEWQLSVFRNIAVVALVAGLLQMVGTYVISTQDPLERWSGQQISLLAFAFNGLFYALMFLALWVVSVRVTHSVVGPARVIKRAVDGIVTGDFDHRLSLRKRDYLKGLAASVKGLSDHIREQTEATDQLAHELVAELTEGNAERALELAKRLKTTPQSVEHEEPKCAA